MSDRPSSKGVVMAGDSKIYRWGEVSGIPGIPGRIPEFVGPPSGLVWTPADASPFGIAGVDVRKYTQAALCATSELATAETFGRLREDDGACHRDARPENPVEARCALIYPGWPKSDQGVWFHALEMEDKLDVFCYDGVVYVSSSWTGELLLCAAARLEGGVLIVERVWGAGEVMADEPEREPPLIVQQFDYALKTHVLGWWCPHPLPADLARDPEEIGSYSFVEYGRRAYFASFEDTTQIDFSLDDPARC